MGAASKENIDPNILAAHKVIPWHDRRTALAALQNPWPYKILGRDLYNGSVRFIRAHRRLPAPLKLPAPAPANTPAPLDFVSCRTIFLVHALFENDLVRKMRNVPQLRKASDAELPRCYEDFLVATGLAVRTKIGAELSLPAQVPTLLREAA